MTTDREQLADLLRAVDSYAGRRDGGSRHCLRAAADRARRHLLLVEDPDGDCAERIAVASRAAYAAGVAHGRGSNPDQRQGVTVDE